MQVMFPKGFLVKDPLYKVQFPPKNSRVTMKEVRREPSRSQGTNAGNLHFSQRKEGRVKLAIFMQKRRLSQEANQEVTELRKSPSRPKNCRAGPLQ